MDSQNSITIAHACAGEGHTLVLLIDCSEQLWSLLRSHSNEQGVSAGKSLSKSQFVQQLLLFLNTYLMLQDGNTLAVYAVDGTGRSCADSPKSA